MTESPSGKVSSYGRLSQQRSVGRPKIPHTVSGLQMATEVGWCFGAPDFVGDHRQLVSDPLLDRQPVQSAKQRLGVGSTWRLEHDPRCLVLHSL